MTTFGVCFPEHRYKEEWTPLSLRTVSAELRMDEKLNRLTELSAEKRALLAKQLRAANGPAQLLMSDPIAVIGIGCRFPGNANSPEAYWELLRDGVDAISEIPADRWDLQSLYDPNPDVPGKMISKWGGFIDQIDHFDPAFFSISPREASNMDPQQRIFLEVAWEALEHAGQAVDQLAGSSTGVFVGVCGSEYGIVADTHDDLINPYTGTGKAPNIIAGRLSYLLDLHGPSVAVDTACSSSLLAVHLACQSLRVGECSMALAGGVNVILAPQTNIMASKMRIMSPDGRCKTFDSRANGYVRGEGCGVVVLKRFSDALADKDPILALIRGSAANQDGKSAGLTAPNGSSQEALLRAALANSGVEPHQIGYVETHGTGTELGDPIEVASLTTVVGQPRPQDQRCFLGAVKTNIGHLEAAAGIAGMIKAILSLRYEAVPPNLHFERLNPHITLSNTPFVVPTKLQPWPAAANRRFAGINSFGWSGTNVHVVLEEAPRALQPAVANPPADAEAPYVLALSARAPGTLKAVAELYLPLLTGADAPAARDVTYTAGALRSHHAHRLAAVGATNAELAERLRAFLAGDVDPWLLQGQLANDVQPEVVFVFPGQGSQWHGMARQLLNQAPVFRQSIEQAETAFRPYVDWSLLDLLASDDTAWLERIDCVQPVLCAVQIALAALWRSWGVEPIAVVGHSMGEIAAAAVAGALSLDDAARIICTRSRLLRRLSGQGAMVSVELSLEAAQAAIGNYGDRVAVAVSNSSRSTVLAGDPGALDEILARLEGEGVFCRRVKVDVASHSPQMDPLLPELRQLLAPVRPTPGALPFFSTVERRFLGGGELDAAYWARNLREPVHFSAAIGQLAANGPTIFLELSPHPILQPAIEGELRERGLRGGALASLRRSEAEIQALKTTLASLYIKGYAVDWRRVYAMAGRPVRLPSYPWQRQRYWLESDAVHSRVRVPAHGGHPLLGRHMRVAGSPATHYWEQTINSELLPYLSDHCVEGMVVVPGAAYVEMGLAAARAVWADTRYRLGDVRFKQMLSLRPDESRVVQVALRESGDTAMFQIFSRGAENESWQEHATGEVVRGALPVLDGPESFDAVAARCDKTMSAATYYAQLAEQGLEYGPAFQGITELWLGDSEVLARIVAPADIQTDYGAYELHPALLDACFQSFVALDPHRNGAEPAVTLPVGVRRIQALRKLQAAEPLWVHTRLSAAAPTADVSFEGDILLLDQSGQPVMRVEGLQVKVLEARAAGGDHIDSWLYTLQWEAQVRPAFDAALAPWSNGAVGGWLIFSDQSPAARDLAAALEAHGQHPVMVAPGERFQAIGGRRYEINPHDHKAYKQLLKEAFGGANAPCRGIVYLWGGKSGRDAEASLDALLSAQDFTATAPLFLLQAIGYAGWRDYPRLWIVTRGADAASPNEAVAVAQTPLTGLSNVISHEFAQLECVRIDLSAAPGLDEASELFNEICCGKDDRVAIRPGQRFVARLSRGLGVAGSAERPQTLARAGDQPFGLDASPPGSLDRLAIRAMARQPIGPDDIEIKVRAWGLNFRDVLTALGAIPGNSSEIEGVSSLRECAGTIVALGANVTGFTVGQEVVGWFKSLTVSHSISTQNLIVAKPDHLTLEQAAALPFAILTAYYSLVVTGRLSKGERVLIHSATGGVGLAAIQIAQHVGAEIFATAGSPEKRALLRELGVPHVMNSRSLDFADEVREATNGEGIDVVLNSLAGDYIKESLNLLRHRGRFIEIGKRDYYEDNKLGMRPFLKNLTFSLVDLDKLREEPEMIGAIFREAMALFAGDSLLTRHCRVFSMGQVADAYRMMAQARHIGKIVIRIDDDEELPIVAARPAAAAWAAGTYLITGGLGGLGIAVARWLVERGVRHLVLLGRSRPGAAASAAVEDLRALGATVQVSQADVAQPAALAALFDDIDAKMPPLRGVIHAAGVLDDGVLLQLTPERFKTVMDPKVTGSWNLHILTRDRTLDHFILFSSAAATLGSPGQGNYAAANAFLDGLAHYRRAQGLPALAINWGPWADVGLAAAQANRGERIAYRGMKSMTPAEGLAALERLIRANPVQANVLPFNLRQWLQYYPKAAASSLFRRLVEELDQSASEQPAQTRLRPLLEEAPPEQRLAIMETHIAKLVQQVLRIPTSALDSQTPLGSMGLDSLMALELRNLLEDSVGLSFPVTLIWNHQSIAALSSHLIERMQISLASAEEPDAFASDDLAAAPELEVSDDLAVLLSAIGELSMDELQHALDIEPLAQGEIDE